MIGDDLLFRIVDAFIHSILVMYGDDADDGDDDDDDVVNGIFFVSTYTFMQSCMTWYLVDYAKYL